MYPDGLTIIIPSYNEAKTIRELVTRVCAVMKTGETPFEIIVIDDHSTDKTLDIVRRLGKTCPVKGFTKQGKRGKGYSILEGAAKANYLHIAMIDADLQYPPEILPELYAKTVTTGIGVARRTTYKSSLLRVIASRLNAFVFGTLLLDLKTDVQSGLKIFHREVFDHLDQSLVSAWAVDIPLLYTAYDLGYRVSHVDIDFRPRNHGSSNVRFFQTSWEIASGAIKTRFSKRVRILPPSDPGSMAGSGIAYQRKRFITHTTLPQALSAIESLTLWQKAAITCLVSLLAVGLIHHLYETAIIATTVISAIYFFDVVFNLFVILKSLHFPPDIRIEKRTLNELDDATLPRYTILCPLYHEAMVLPQFIQSMESLDWPKQKLEVLILLESDDKETREAAASMRMPSYVRIVTVPDSQPKTKPKACNFGLNEATGEYIVVYDAEDKPDPLQLKKAYAAFQTLPETIACVQAKLNYYNPEDNLLTRLFTAEYSLWFDVVLPGLQSIETTIPLGGTSNHFKRDVLVSLHGWDPFNVTEDADLGARLFRMGYKTAIIDSTTLEEANSDVKNWFRQRSRWIKGYIQTYFVHLRDPIEFVKKYGRHAFLFQLIVGGKIAFMLINPILWLITISYFVFYAYVGPAIESIYPTIVFYMAATSLVFGNFIYLYNYMIGVAKRDHWELVKYVFLVPFYWLMISISAAIALVQFFVKPYYWEKTIHGLHINRKTRKDEKDLRRLTQRAKIIQAIADRVQTKFLGNAALVGAALLGNVFNFLYNAYLGRKVSLEDFGLISLIGSFLYFTQVPFSSLSRSITHKSAFLFGQYNTPVTSFWKKYRRINYWIALCTAALWLISTPVLKNFFHADSLVPFILFTPVWVIGMVSAVDRGFLNGNLMFVSLAVAAVSEAIFKLLFSVVLIETGFHEYVYASIPLSMLISFGLTWFYAAKITENMSVEFSAKKSITFPMKFYITSILTSLASMTYLSLDVLIAKHFLSADDAGKYGFLSLAGKMILFLGSLVSQFLIPYVSRELGAGRSSEKVFRSILRISILANVGAYLVFGIFGFITVPILWGSKSTAIISLLPVYGMAMVTYSLSSIIITYHQLRKNYVFPFVGFALSALQIIGSFIYHNSMTELAYVIGISGVLTLSSVMILHKFYDEFRIIYRNIVDLIGLFRKLPEHSKLPKGKKRILIFNWRDRKHMWAGGAEVYIQELAKRWVSDGHEVTIFCGNDTKNQRYEVTDGVKIIRRGGFFTVYIWAFLYYRIRLRGKYDIIIDSENGLPFFTPLYAEEKIFLLIHHVHQEVFRKSLVPPFSWIALFLEKRVMPMVYKKTRIITVSPSSKADILRHKLTFKDPSIVYNGVDLNSYKPGIKHKTPTVLYLGRLTTAKSISVFIYAAKRVLATLPDVQFIIAGDGPHKSTLIRLVTALGLNSSISFTGRISEKEKITLLQAAWLFVNPSLIEGWGITTIEANACGTPVIASNVPGLKDAVCSPHSGILIPYGNYNEFGTEIIRLLKSTRTRQRMEKDAVKWAANFDWNKSAREGLRVILS